MLEYISINMNPNLDNPILSGFPSSESIILFLQPPPKPPFSPLSMGTTDVRVTPFPVLLKRSDSFTMSQ